MNRRPERLENKDLSPTIFSIFHRRFFSPFHSQLVLPLPKPPVRSPKHPNTRATDPLQNFRHQGGKVGGVSVFCAGISGSLCGSARGVDAIQGEGDPPGVGYATPGQQPHDGRSETLRDSSPGFRIAHRFQIRWWALSKCSIVCSASATLTNSRELSKL
jgi:hypothetical protein